MIDFIFKLSFMKFFSEIQEIKNIKMNLYYNDSQLKENNDKLIEETEDII